MFKKLISTSLILALILCVSLPVSASQASATAKPDTIKQAVEFLKGVQAGKPEIPAVKGSDNTAGILTLPSQPFYVTQFCDAINTVIYSRNQTGTINQAYFPLLVGTYQKGSGVIDEVKVDGIDIPAVYTVDDFYYYGDYLPIFLVVEQDPADTSTSWYTFTAISTLSRGIHTIQIFCTVDGTRLSDTFRINVV